MKKDKKNNKSNGKNIKKDKNDIIENNALPLLNQENSREESASKIDRKDFIEKSMKALAGGTIGFLSLVYFNNKVYADETHTDAHVDTSDGWTAVNSYFSNTNWSGEHTHTDNSHSDNPHSDVPVYNDSPEYSDVAHTDNPPHSDSAHTDSTPPPQQGEYDGIVSQLPGAEQKLNELSGKVPFDDNGKPQQDDVKDDDKKSKADTGGDPVRMATGEFVFNETDLLYRYINAFIELKRDYQSCLLSSHSLGKGWSFNYDTRIIMGVKKDAQKRVNDLTSLLSEINEFLNNIVLPMQYEMSKVISYVNGGGVISGYSESISTRVDALVTGTIALRDRVDGLLKQAIKDLHLANANIAKNVYTVNNSDPEYYQYIGNLALNFIDENGNPHLYYINTAPDYESLDKYPDGNTNFFTGGASTTPSTKGDDILELLADGSYILTKKDKTKYYFSYYGQIKKIVDSNGNILSFLYSNNQLREIKDDFARSIILDRDSNGRIIKTTDPKGRVIYYSYNGEYLFSVIDAAGDAVQYLYNGNLLVQIVKPDGSSRKYIYVDLNGKKVISSTVDEEGNTETFSYNTTDKYTVYTSASGIFEKTYYNGKYQTTKIEYGDGSTVLMEYDDDGNVVKKTDELGRIYKFKYDGNKNVIEATDPDGCIENWTYNNFNKISSYKNKKDKNTNYTYDGNGNLLSVELPDSSTTKHEYNNRGQVTKYTDENNNVQIIKYDNYGYVNAVIYPEGNVITNENDITGNVTRQIDPEGNVTILEYNADDKVVKATDSLGKTVRYVYNNRKDLVEKTDKNGNKMQIQYDKRHKPILLTNPKGETLKNKYDGDGNILEKIINNINHAEYNYDMRGKISCIKQIELGISTYFNHDPAGNLVSQIDGNGNQTQYGYDDLNRLSWLKNPDNTLKQYKYDENGNLILVTDEAGNKMQYVYDVRDRGIQKIDALNNTEQFIYDNKSNMTGLIDPNGNKIIFKYNKNDKVVEIVDPLNGSIKYEYNLKNLPAKVTDKKGNITQYVYDKIGRVIKKINPLNNNKEYIYDANGNMLSLKDENGNVRRFEFDSLNNAVSVIDPYDNKIGYTYNYLGAIEKITDPMNNNISRNYDELGRLIKETNQLGASKRYEYDKNGNLIKEIDEINRITAYIYDAMNRKTSDINALGQIITYEYDKIGNLIIKTDAKENKYNYEYDSLGRMIKEKNASGNLQIYGYDKNSNIITKIDFNEEKTSNDYDDLNRLIRTSFADGTKKEIDYDPNGNILKAENDIKSINFQYDAMNRLIIQFDNKVNQTQKIKYDKAGNKIEISWLDNKRVIKYDYGKINELLNVIDPEKGKTSFNYDKLGREIKKVMANGLITETIYDAAGRVIATKNYKESDKCFWYDDRTNENQNMNFNYNMNPWNGHDRTKKSYAYIYNDAGERTYQIDEDGNISAYQYDEVSRISDASYPFRGNKKTDDFRERLYFGLFPECDVVRGNREDFVFDLPKINIPDYKNEDLENSLKDVFSDNVEFYKSYKNLDMNHFPKWKVKREFDGTEFIKKLELDTNTQNQMKDLYFLISGHSHINSDQWMWIEKYEYDPNSNISTKANGWGKIDYSFDETNAMKNAGKRNYLYDKNGNLKNEKLGYIEAKYEYNPENRVTDIYSEISGFICHRKWKLKGGVGYDYDAFGRRGSSADYFYNGSGYRKWSVETNENYFYDGLSMDVLADFWQEDFNPDHGHHCGWDWWGHHTPRHNPKAEYVYGNGKIINRTDFEQSNGWFGHQYFPRWNVKTYYSQDVLGSVMLLTMHHGEAVEEYNYGVFGNDYEGTYLRRNEFGYNGKRFDPIVKLYDYGFRDYSPMFCRWTTLDPIKDGNNWYVYCKNDPVNWKDLLGLWTDLIHVEATTEWARIVGFSPEEADRIAQADNSVDFNPSTSPKSLSLSNNSWHFNINNDSPSNTPGDSRIIHSEEQLQIAIDLQNSANDARKNGVPDYIVQYLENTALTELGRGLHPLQDVYAHTDDMLCIPVYITADGQSSLQWHLPGIPIAPADNPVTRPLQVDRTALATLDYFDKFINATKECGD